MVLVVHGRHVANPNSSSEFGPERVTFGSGSGSVLEFGFGFEFGFRVRVRVRVRFWSSGSGSGSVFRVRVRVRVRDSFTELSRFLVSDRLSLCFS